MSEEWHSPRKYKWRVEYINRVSKGVLAKYTYGDCELYVFKGKGKEEYALFEGGRKILKTSSKERMEKLLEKHHLPPITGGIRGERI
jgi:hypothetical protein